MRDDGSGEAFFHRQKPIRSAGKCPYGPAVVFDREKRHHPPESGEIHQPPAEKKLLGNGNDKSAADEAD